VLVTRIKTVPRPVILHFIQVIAPPATKSNATDTTTESVVVDAVGIIDSAINDDDDDDDDDDDEVKQDHSNDGVSHAVNHGKQGPMIVDVDIVDDDDGGDEDEGGEDCIPITSAPQKDRYAMRRVHHDILFYIQNADGGDGGVDDDDDDDDDDIDEDDDDNI
jgi:hypothetical protein